MRDLLARLLVDLGHDVTAVSSGVEALREAVGSRFDLVLTDLGMPELNGWELATRLKVADPSLHIALVTGWGGQLDEAQLARSDIDTVLAKPFQIEDLAALVAQVAERRRRSGAAGARAAAPAGTARRARPS
jgi:CheY-like chemotaxis protein